MGTLPMQGPAMIALLAAQDRQSKANEAYRDAHQRHADAQRDLGSIKDELLKADADAPGFDDLVQKRTVAEARTESLAHRLRAAEEGSGAANVAANAAGVEVQRDQLAQLEGNARKLEAEIRASARAFTEDLLKDFEKLRGFMLEGARLQNALEQTATGRNSNRLLAFTDSAGFTENVIRTVFTGVLVELTNHDQREHLKLKGG